MNPRVTIEKRLFSRILFDAPVELSTSEKHWQSHLIDISLKGALIRKPGNWQARPSGEYELDVQLGDKDSHISMQAMIAHEDADQIGFNCVHIDLDSVSCLKRLVELNLSDEALLERELDHLIVC